MRKHGARLYRFIRGGERSRHFPHRARARNPKPLVLAAFFGYFLSLVTESTPPEAIFAQGILPFTDSQQPNHLVPRKNPSTSLRLVPLPLGKGGDGFSGVRWLTGGRVRAARPTEYRKRFGKAGRCRHRPLRRGSGNSSVIGRGRTPPLRIFERFYNGRTGVSAPTKAQQDLRHKSGRMDLIFGGQNFLAVRSQSLTWMPLSVAALVAFCRSFSLFLFSSCTSSSSRFS